MRIDLSICRQCLEAGCRSELGVHDHGLDGFRKKRKKGFALMFGDDMAISNCFARTHCNETDGYDPTVFISSLELQLVFADGKESSRCLAAKRWRWMRKYVERFDDFELSKECPFYLEQVASDALRPRRRKGMRKKARRK